MPPQTPRVALNYVKRWNGRDFAPIYLMIFWAPRLAERSKTCLQLLAVLSLAKGWAKALAERTAGSVEKLYEIALSRPPSALERQTAEAFLDRQMKIYASSGRADAAAAAWVDIAHAVMISNEVMTLP